MQKCKTCDCYSPDTMGDNVAPYGVCKRKPPVIIMTPRQKIAPGRVSKVLAQAATELEIVPASYWPQVRESDGCGEYIPVTNTATAN
jgi:hypothetical protein